MKFSFLKYIVAVILHESIMKCLIFMKNKNQHDLFWSMKQLVGTNTQATNIGPPI